MAARTAKNILNSTLQEQLFDPSAPQQPDQELKLKVTDFMNCLLGQGEETAALWTLVWRNIHEHYQLSGLSVEDLDKGQLIVATAYHCQVRLTWDNI